MQLCMMPLTFRRDINDLLFLFKCLHGFIDLNIYNYVQFRRPRAIHTRSAVDCLLLHIPKCKTTHFSKLYFIRVIRMWNELPIETRSSPSLYSFINRLRTHIINTKLPGFNVNNQCTWHLRCQCDNCVQSGLHTMYVFAKYSQL